MICRGAAISSPNTTCHLSSGKLQALCVNVTAIQQAGDFSSPLRRGFAVSVLAGCGSSVRNKEKEWHLETNEKKYYK